jgi:hypothetical protein
MRAYPPGWSPPRPWVLRVVRRGSSGDAAELSVTIKIALCERWAGTHLKFVYRDAICRGGGAAGARSTGGEGDRLGGASSLLSGAPARPCRSSHEAAIGTAAIPTQPPLLYLQCQPTLFLWEPVCARGRGQFQHGDAQSRLGRSEIGVSGGSVWRLAASTALRRS